MSEQKLTQDEALAKTMVEYVESIGGSITPNTPDENVPLLLAEYMRTEVIDPAVIAGSVKLLTAHRTALYELVPVGDIDAMGLLNIIQEHLLNVDNSIASLNHSLKSTEAPESEAKQKPLDRMAAQEAEIVDEDKKS